jgi:hypothetical protein
LFIVHDIAQLKNLANGRWAEIANRVGGLGDEFIKTVQGPCPKCGGNTRFRVFPDFGDTGGAVCNQCGKFGDGIALVGWLTGDEANCSGSIAKIAQYLGVGKLQKGSIKKGDPRGFAKVKADSEQPKPKPEPKPTNEEDLVPIKWDEMQVKFWCAKKQPITPESLLKCGAWLAKYKGTIRVIVVPCGKNYVIYNLAGGTLMGGKDEWIKVKCINKYAGWIKAAQPS